LRRQDVLEHRGSDRPALAAEQVERYAAGNCGADGRVAEGDSDFGDVVTAGECLVRLVRAIDEVHVPAVFAARHGEVAAEAATEVPGVHVLLEDTRARLERPARYPAEVAGGIQVDAERVVGIESRN